MVLLGTLCVISIKGGHWHQAGGQILDAIANKSSCLSLVSNAILMWNTIKIDGIIKQLEAHGEVISDETLSHISLLPYKHVLPNGTYFIDDE